MKRLTREERKGAVMVAVVSLIVCGGAFIIRKMERMRADVPDEEIVKMIVIATDSGRNIKKEELEIEPSEQSKASAKNSKIRSRSDRKDVKKKKRRKTGENGTTGKKTTKPSRDFLSDPL